VLAYRTVDVIIERPADTYKVKLEPTMCVVLINVLRNIPNTGLRKHIFPQYLKGCGGFTVFLKYTIIKSRITDEI
jgi:hypothetical protein